MRMLQGIADGAELTGRIPLECNFDALGYVDFNKGCYVGQELTARTKHQVRISNFCDVLFEIVGHYCDMLLYTLHCELLKKYTDE